MAEEQKRKSLKELLLRNDPKEIDAYILELAGLLDDGKGPITVDSVQILIMAKLSKSSKTLERFSRVLIGLTIALVLLTAGLIALAVPPAIEAMHQRGSTVPCHSSQRK